ncbi:unnamed protein product, partial [Chrysoparadoxa australica]
MATGSRWVIGDIHGCFQTYQALLNKINLQKEDQLFLLGDYINKGPQSLEVIEVIMSSKKNVFPLLGNHDKKLLEYYIRPTFDKKEELVALGSGKLLVQDKNTI